MLRTEMERRLLLLLSRVCNVCTREAAARHALSEAEEHLGGLRCWWPRQNDAMMTSHFRMVTS